MQLYPDHAYAAMAVLQKARHLQLHIPCGLVQCDIQLHMNMWGFMSESRFARESYHSIDLQMALKP